MATKPRSAPFPALSPLERQALELAKRFGFLEEFAYTRQTNDEFQRYCRANNIAHVTMRVTNDTASVYLTMPEKSTLDQEAQRAVLALTQWNRRPRSRATAIVTATTARIRHVHRDDASVLAGKLVRIASLSATRSKAGGSPQLGSLS
jgi:hypothetical protein